MQVTIKSTSSIVDDLVLIETATTIGEMTTTSRAGYPVDEVMDNRFLAGSLEDRVETLRGSAERMTETSVRLHFQALVKIATPEPVVEDVSAVPLSQVAIVTEGTLQTMQVKEALEDAGVKIQGQRGDVLIVDEVATTPSTKKPRAKRTTTKPTKSK